jgi:hypothetical protein
MPVESPALKTSTLFSTFIVSMLCCKIINEKNSVRYTTLMGQKQMKK